jgi:outer membrane immunogenic protein
MKRCFLAGIGLTALSMAPSFAADMPVKAPIYTPPVYWTGWYVGGNAGWVGSDNQLTTTATPTPDVLLGVVPGVSEGLAALSTGTIPTGNHSGFIGGGQIGYNWQFASWVAGIEADIQGISQSGGSGSTRRVVVGVPVTSTETATVETRYLGTVRGRLGFLVTPNWLVYGTGGLAYGGVNASMSLAQSGTNGFVGTGAGTFSDSRVGWTAGAGLEWMFARNWSAKLEYLHYDLGTGSFASAAVAPIFPVVFGGTTSIYQHSVSSARFEGDLLRAGVNLHF